ncbi:isoprenylcysteine carboxylmethyltransferase family protein [Patescibacteria group bacterium]|nr:isoprenylcysteine carboxylmethyltransferase family protein [Patescibacteria group bacterium]MBU1448704.1 isoprenylcysteine carboxylmethyltransferase family protein [Patescibacteria group bacterium]MBU2613240.1 isoprenylcysteine carboxylmethyltransferase family protein [Patescibacteria group bacterium]
MKMALLLPLSFVVLGLFLGLSAGTIWFWQGWLFCAVLFVPLLFVMSYFLKASPEFLERRMKYAEKEKEQRWIIAVTNVFFLVGLVLPGLDYRYGWSSVPVWMILAADVVVLIGYALIFLTFKENAFAGRTVEIFEGQRVIETGPYAVVRHPMYAGIIPMFLGMPIALGSFVAIIPLIPVCGLIILRTLNEEAVLRRDLPGYAAYCTKVRYRLIPSVW